MSSHPHKLSLPLDSIVKDYVGGKTGAEIAESYGCHRTTIVRLLRRAGMKELLRASHTRPKISGAQLNEVVSAYESGMGLIEIGNSYGVSQKAVTNALRRARVSIRGVHALAKARAVKRRKTLNERYSPEEQRKVWAANFALRPKVAWNKGLTKDTDARVAAQGQSTLGHQAYPGSGHGKSGYREDIGLWVRSTWEADICRVLSLLVIPFEYESKSFPLQYPNGEIHCYRPDFWLAKSGLWVEVSGWVSPEKKDRVELFRQQYPSEALYHLDVVAYSGLHVEFGGQIQWEGKARGHADCTDLLALLKAAI